LLLRSGSRQFGTRAVISEEENRAERLRQRNKARSQTVSIQHRDDGQLNLRDTCAMRRESELLWSQLMVGLVARTS
jgi:hypothetical protein